MSPHEERALNSLAGGARVASEAEERAGARERERVVRAGGDARDGQAGERAHRLRDLENAPCARRRSARVGEGDRAGAGERSGR